MSQQPQTDYDPYSYWNERENPNNDLGESPARVAFDTGYIASCLGETAGVFELGPGVGRTFPAYRSGMTVTTLDISQRYKDRLAERASAAGITLHQHHASATDAPFPFAANAFELGVCCQVFLHQPPEVFQHAIDEMTRVCDAIILISGRSAIGNPDRETGPKHVFRHDHIRALNRRGFRCNNVMSREGVLYLHACRGLDPKIAAAYG